MDKTKPFGLIVPKGTKKSSLLNRSSIFDSDSDDDPSQKKICNTKIPQAKSISKTIPKIVENEDPSIYEYDNIYDNMKAEQIEKIAFKDKNKPSRYIDTLLKAADKRKKEYERRTEKKVQIEREKEGDKFKDKESFVTSAYKKKMQEMEEEEERERRRNELNDMMDVTKQKDLTGFYRHFLNQTVGEEKIPGAVDIKQEPKKKEEKSNSKIEKMPSKQDKRETELCNIKSFADEDRDSDIVSSCSDDELSVQKPSCSKNLPKISRNFRQSRKKSLSSSEEEISKCVSNQISSNQSKQPSSIKKLQKESHHSEPVKKQGIDDDSHSDNKTSDEEEEYLNPQVKVKESSLSKRKRSDNDSAENTGVKKVAKTNMYAKRTEGEIFTNAQTRYFQRMAIRNRSI